MQYPTFLEAAYKHFTNDSDEMNGNQYLQFAKECGLLDRTFTKSDITILFAKSADQERKIIGFEIFKENFSHIALKKKVTRNDVVRQIEVLGKKFLFKLEMFDTSSVCSSSRPTLSDLSAGSNNSV